MSCGKRNTTGACGHHQCEFTDETDHGFECVDVKFGSGRSFCECGEDCVAKCPHSWKGTDQATQANAWRAFGIDEDEITLIQSRSRRIQLTKVT